MLLIRCDVCHAETSHNETINVSSLPAGIYTDVCFTCAKPVLALLRRNKILPKGLKSAKGFPELSGYANK